MGQQKKGIIGKSGVLVFPIRECKDLFTYLSAFLLGFLIGKV